MVVSGHPLASSVGVQILQRGGNAADASVAMAAVLGVVKPHSCGLGGDFLALTYENGSNEVRSLHGIGRAPGGADPKRLGASAAEGAKAITVPGAVGGWMSLSAEYGRLPMETLLRPAVSLARSGFPMYEGLARIVARHRFRLAADPDIASLLMGADNTPWPIGTCLVNKALADTLEAIASGGPTAFYEGRIAGQIADRVEQLGGWLSRGDLAAHTSSWAAPISVCYRGHTVYEHPPPSQGILLLEMLNILSEDELSDYPPESHERIHLLVEAKKLAFADRRRFLGDPDHVDVPIELLLDKARGLRLRAGIDRDAIRARGDVSSLDGDTTAFAVVDSDHNAVAGIQSLFSGFGSGVYVPSVGVIMNDRASSFTAGYGHLNSLFPDRRPAHTLTSYMVFDGDGLLLLGGTPGGNGQVQTNLQVITSIFADGTSLQDAVEAPRWISGSPINEASTEELVVEHRFPSSTTAALKDMGYEVSLAEDFDALMGSAKVIQWNRETGTLHAGVDPRRDAAAIAL